MSSRLRLWPQEEEEVAPLALVVAAEGSISLAAAEADYHRRKPSSLVAEARPVQVVEEEVAMTWRMD